MPSPDAKKRVMDLLKGSKATTGYYGLLDLSTLSLVEEIYTSPSYSAPERAKLAAYYQSNPVHVIGEYPRTQAKFPCIIVARAGDSEEPVLGDAFGFDDEEDSEEESHEASGTWLQEQIKLEIWSVGAGGVTERDALYLAVREILLRGRKFFSAAEIREIRWSSGRDGRGYQPSSEPQLIHTAEATLTCKVPLWWVTITPKPTTLQSRAYHPDVVEGEVTPDPSKQES